MTTIEITNELKKEREYVIARLTKLFPGQSLKTSMEGLVEYCVNYDFDEDSDVDYFIDKYRQQETSFNNLNKSSDINDTMKEIRTNTRNRWGI